MKIKKFENLNNEDVNWNANSINELIKYYKGEIERLEEQESSSFPEGEEEKMNRCDECLDLLRGMLDKKSWYYKHFNK